MHIIIGASISEPYTIELILEFLYMYIKLITWVSVKYDELFHEQHRYFHVPKASRNTDYE